MNDSSSYPASGKKRSLGLVMRFHNSSETLPEVLAAIERQTRRPDVFIGINNQSTDGSAEILRKAGATVLDWCQPYNHSRVLNYAFENCPTDLVLVLSSHTVPLNDRAFEMLEAAFDDPKAACASAKPDDDPLLSCAITYEELKRRGMKIASIYSNSFGMIRRSLWQTLPFDETLPTMEDYAWALEMVKRGWVCCRVRMDFHYKRSGNPRYFIFAAIAFRLGVKYDVQIMWFGVKSCIKALARCFLRLICHGDRDGSIRHEIKLHSSRMIARLTRGWPLRLKE